ncbi:NADH-quinone oxidoreductase subunit N [Planomonospora sp. ID82291]|uniref:NADH-quinone oxidoreductase subunit N n=1 Tax=Planomonospora sp. ID82291 TaxID=2738136 RepID=UPI0018C38865|nr:NADH-quinone oxidoreductase subunit N [Planomonospora sp. ID82291]MBG0813869.1 NADH-quinone oxidoreductase subunit N [Planomonospora sp. ID82291]
MIQSIDYYAIAPPLILALVAGLVLLLDAFLPRRPYSRPLLGGVTLAGLLGALGVVVAQALRTGAPLRTFCVPEGLAGPSRTGLIPSGPVGGGLPAGDILPAGDMPAIAAGPSCSFVVDGFTLVFAGLALAAGIVVALLSMAEIASGEDVPAGEWHFLLLCVLTGAVALPAARDLVMLVVALELVSLPVFALTALRRYDGRASEAAVKLFLVSVVSTAVMLFGVSLLYGVTGSVHLDRLARALREYAPWSGADLGPVQESGQAYASSLQISHDLPPVLTVAMVLVLAGFAFKVAAVPFHAWAADVYQGAPVPVAALLSVISKAAGFAGLILILVAALPAQAALWAPIIAIVAALTMTAGNLLALRQRHAVRLLAWSSVAQSGYILAPLGVPTREAANASIAYLVFYAAMNLGAFAVVMLVSRRDGQEEIDGYRGLAFRRPVAGLSLVFFLICLAGLPPGLAGLFAKIVVFREIVDGGGAWPAAVMAVNTVIGLYYYVTWAARILTPVPAHVPIVGETGTTIEETGTTIGMTAGASGTAAGASGVIGAPGAPGPGAGPPDTTREVPGTTRAEPGSRAGWLPVGVAIILSGLAAVAFSVAPQVVLDLVPGFLLAFR